MFEYSDLGKYQLSEETLFLLKLQVSKFYIFIIIRKGHLLKCPPLREKMRVYFR